MRVFVTGATGFIGSAVVKELIGAGHQVLGLTRSDLGAGALIDAGAEVHRGTLEDAEGLRSGAAACDGVIHTAYNNDFSQFAAAGEMDRRAVEVLGNALAGSDRPLVITSAIGVLSAGRPTTKDDAGDPNGPGAVRIPSEEKALALSSEGLRSSIIRLPLMVHNRTKQGLATRLIGLARQDRRLGLYQRRGQSLASRTPARCRTSLSAGPRKGSGGKQISCDCRRRNSTARDRRGDRQNAQRTSCRDIAG